MHTAVLLLSLMALLGWQLPPLERGAQALQRGDASEALRALEQATREQPNSARAHKLLGMAHSMKEAWAPAETAFRTACRLDKKERNACYYLARVLYSMNRFDESLAVVEEALRTGACDRHRALTAKGLALEAVGRNAEAERAHKDAASSGTPEALTAYGLFLFHQGRAKESLPLLTRAGASEELKRVQRTLEGGVSVRGRSSSGAAVQFEVQALPMTVRNGATGEKRLIETMIAGAAVLDYDNDGRPDLYLSNGATIPDLVKAGASFHNRLLRNSADGTFVDVTERAGLMGAGYSMGAAAGDFDNDSRVDLFVTGVRSNTLYRNRGDGTFEDLTLKAGIPQDGRWAVAAGWFDYDNDGWLDLFVVRYVEWDPKTEPFCGEPKPGYRSYCHPKLYRPLANALYRNEGGARFRDVSAESGIGSHAGKGMGTVFGDYDGDGRLDIFVANDKAPNFLFHNNGDGTFTETALQAGVAFNEDGAASSWMGADFRDLDNDGLEDLFVTSLSNDRFSLYRNLGGWFADASSLSRISTQSLPWTGWSTGAYDLNNDGWKDLFVAGGNVMDNAELTSSRKSRQPNLIFLNHGDRTFQMTALTGEALHRGAAFADFDGDGRVDVAVTRLNEAAFLLRNTTPARGHWLALKLEGRASNRSAIGALIRVTTPGGEQWNRVTSSVGYGGSSDLAVHFGLKEARADNVEIRWPSGIRQTLRDVAADRVLSVREPER